MTERAEITAVARGGEMAVMGAFKCYNHVSDAIALLKEQERIIELYQKADGFLFAHGWKWENYIDTQEESHPIEVGEENDATG